VFVFVILQKVHSTSGVCDCASAEARSTIDDCHCESAEVHSKPCVCDSEFAELHSTAGTCDCESAGVHPQIGVRDGEYAENHCIMIVCACAFSEVHCNIGVHVLSSYVCGSSTQGTCAWTETYPATLHWRGLGGSTPLFICSLDAPWEIDQHSCIDLVSEWAYFQVKPYLDREMPSHSALQQDCTGDILQLYLFVGSPWIGGVVLFAPLYSLVRWINPIRTIACTYANSKVSSYRVHVRLCILSAAQSSSSS
jgi:hypothetical protein